MKSVMHFPSTAFLHIKNYLSIDWPSITIIKLSLIYQSVFLSTYLVLQSLVMSYSLRLRGLQHARLPCPSLPRSLLKLMCFESMMPSNHLILYHPLILLSSVFPSIRVFSNVSALQIRWPKYWSFSIGPSNEYSGLTSFRMDWLDLLAVQGTLKSLLQHHSLKASILQCSAFLMVQLSHLYMTTGENNSLDDMDICQQCDVSAF